MKTFTRVSENNSSNVRETSSRKRFPHFRKKRLFTPHQRRPSDDASSTASCGLPTGFSNSFGVAVLTSSQMQDGTVASFPLASKKHPGLDIQVRLLPRSLPWDGGGARGLSSGTGSVGLRRAIGFRGEWKYRKAHPPRTRHRPRFFWRRRSSSPSRTFRRSSWFLSSIRRIQRRFHYPFSLRKWAFCSVPRRLKGPLSQSSFSQHHLQQRWCSRQAPQVVPQRKQPTHTMKTITNWLDHLLRWPNVLTIIPSW